MGNTTIYDNLIRLGYAQLWLESGILTDDNLEEQIKELDLGEDDNTEHYRYRTFTNYLNQRTSIDNSILKQIFHLLKIDADKAMANSAAICLLRNPSLTDKQFDTVADFLQTFGDWAIKYIDKERQQRTKL